MAALPTINPYPDLGTNFPTDMTAIIGAPHASIDNVVTEVLSIITSRYFGGVISSPAIQQEIKAVAYSSVNSFVNGLITGANSSLFNGRQNIFINMMIGTSFINYITVDAVGNRIADIEDNISKSDLTVDEQTPLLIATEIGAAAYNYWLTQIAAGVGSPWNTIFGTAKVSAMGNVPFWVAATMEGALIGAKSTNLGMIEQTTQIAGNQIISAYAAALTISACKTIFLLTRRIQNNLSLNNIAHDCNTEIIGVPYTGVKYFVDGKSITNIVGLDPNN